MACNRLQHVMHDMAALRSMALDIFRQCCLCLIMVFNLALKYSVSSVRCWARSAFTLGGMGRGIVACTRAPQLTSCVLSALNQLGCGEMHVFCDAVA